MTITPTTTTELLQSREGCIQIATAATENYRECMLMVVEAWVKNEKEYGPLEELAEAIDKSFNTLRGYKRDLRKLGRLPKSNNARYGGANNKSKTRSASITNVENPKEEDVIDVEVMQPERLPGETFIQMKQRQRNNNTPAPNDNVRRHQLERINQRSDDGALTRADWFIPDHIEDREAHFAYQQIIGLLDEAAILSKEWMLTRRIDDSLWDKIIGHSQSIIAFASCRKSDLADTESDREDVDGITIDIAAEGE